MPQQLGRALGRPIIRWPKLSVTDLRLESNMAVLSPHASCLLASRSLLLALVETGVIASVVPRH